MHILLKLILVVAVTAVFTISMAVRPGREKPMSKSAIVLCIVVGIIISAVMLATQSLYVQQSIA
ncbi:MAG: hypothetical protein K6T83_18825 [Alicyclobacillus sp.]|nr:hypothetical protein [Alicyclobacillus sp.]